MQIPDTLPYVNVMEEIKRRIFVINHCLGSGTELLGPPRVELAALQLRMVLELICLGSIAANRELFEQNSMKFEKHWHPGEIIRDMEKLNPRFFPVPFKAGSTPIPRTLPSKLIMSGEECHGTAKKIQCGVQA